MRNEDKYPTSRLGFRFKSFIWGQFEEFYQRNFEDVLHPLCHPQGLTRFVDIRAFHFLFVELSLIANRRRCFLQILFGHKMKDILLTILLFLFMFFVCSPFVTTSPHIVKVYLLTTFDKTWKMDIAVFIEILKLFMTCPRALSLNIMPNLPNLRLYKSIWTYQKFSRTFCFTWS